ncbi:MAG: mechanosensitive ion channel family protein [Candidatus Omnitrophica bacterium]|jgi:small-conductance mechanosensitive channel|nr:mechanosensitive ion channel family protein [Candidatus Omnitrophota bacterium]
MDKPLFLRFQGLGEIFTPLIIFLVVLFIGLIVRKIIFARLAYWAKKTSTQLDDVIVETVKGPFVILSLMLGLYFALQFSKLPENIVQVLSKSILILGIISVVLALANLLSGVIKVYASRIDSALPVTSLTQNIARIFVFSIGALIILNSLGVSITPILATLGVGGLAVALALQDTLSNLFAGFHITVAKQVRVGDYIKLETGEEGYVVDINWRSTKVKMLPNNLVLIPNDKLNKAIVTNYNLPDKEMAVLIDLGVHYKSDLEKVEKITCEVAKTVMTEVSGGVAYFEPFIRFNAFGDSGIKFTVILRAKEFVDQYLIKHEFIKRLHKRYAQEGINIPYPTRTINYEQQKGV